MFWLRLECYNALLIYENPALHADKSLHYAHAETFPLKFDDFYFFRPKFYRIGMLAKFASITKKDICKIFGARD